MNINQMSTEVSTLRERLAAQLTSKGPCTSVLAEVISQVATFLEHAPTSIILALEVEFDAPSGFVLHLNCLMPLSRDVLEKFGLEHCNLMVLLELCVITKLLIPI